MKYLIRNRRADSSEAWWCGINQPWRRWVHGEQGRTQATRLTLMQAQELCVVNGWSEGRIVEAEPEPEWPECVTARA